MSLRFATRQLLELNFGSGTIGGGRGAEFEYLEQPSTAASQVPSAFDFGFRV